MSVTNEVTGLLYRLAELTLLHVLGKDSSTTTVGTAGTLRGKLKLMGRERYSLYFDSWIITQDLHSGEGGKDQMLIRWERKNWGANYR